MFKGIAILIYICGGVIIPFVVRAYGKITKLEYCDAVSKTLIAEKKITKKKLSIYFNIKRISIF